ncbi:hypothetical protein C8R46DRAFT_1027725 [Mycena filopes]|nr:hypothetical protein C8R46DRAFT_1027725 [Mycena filopes]
MCRLGLGLKPPALARNWRLGLHKIPGPAATPRPGSALARLWLKPGLWVIFFLWSPGWLKAGAFWLGFGFQGARPGQKPSQADISAWLWPGTKAGKPGLCGLRPKPAHHYAP